MPLLQCHAAAARAVSGLPDLVGNQGQLRAVGGVKIAEDARRRHVTNVIAGWRRKGSGEEKTQGRERHGRRGLVN